MLIDARALPNGTAIGADVCVVGAGAAGLTIGCTLRDRGARVVVLEGGGARVCPDAQHLNRGVVAGHPYYALDACRVRALGGATTAWGGWCRPLDPIDFEPLALTGDGAWPFPKSELAPFYARAETICRLAPTGGDDRAWNEEAPPPLLARGCDLFHAAKFQVQPTRFGDLYGGVLRRCRGADVVLNANVVDVDYDAGTRRVRGIRALTRPGSSIEVHADRFVLAAGGLENARILLNSTGPSGRAVGNEHDLVGRYFFDHLHVLLGIASAGDGGGYYQLQRSNGTRMRRALAPSDRSRPGPRRLGFALTFHNARDPHDIVGLGQRGPGYASLQALAAAVRARHYPDDTLTHLRNMLAHAPEVVTGVYRRVVKPAPTTLLVGCRSEQVPTRDSRVTLDASRDGFGMPRIRLDWRVGTEDLATVARAQSMIGGALAGFQPFAPAAGHPPVWGGAHHMGTTRMDRDPRQGVVDENGRVHASRNLYVAGSSVFPSGGWAPPTLTIVALALRLAEHLASGRPAGDATA